MSAKRLVARKRATRDVQLAIAYYVDEAGSKVAQAFSASVEATFRRISQSPRAGSPRVGHEFNVPGLRAKPVGRFPYLVFYIEHGDQVDIVRVLHAQRNIPDYLRETS